jgi:hypothetical protein
VNNPNPFAPQTINQVRFEHLVAGYTFMSGSYKALAPVVECADGTRLSVQASGGHNCIPKTEFGPYTSVEVYFVTAKQRPAGWKRYQNQWDRDRYDYVPVELVRAFILEHGGQVSPAIG